jgi:hypothetical protein
MSRNDRPLRIYQCALRLLPREFRKRYGDEMVLTARDRIQSEGWSALLAECLSVLLTAVQLRLGRRPLHAPALITALLLFMLLRGGAQPMAPRFALSARDSVDFSASDPAGDFTLRVRHGRAIAATIDQQPISRKQLVHSGDSIHVLNRRGRVLFAVAYNRQAATINWEARPAACKGRALECGVYE